MSNETHEQHTKRTDEENENEKKELSERLLQRQEIVAKHKAVLDASIMGKQKGIRFRNHFHAYVMMLSTKKFETERDEYKAIGKPGRLPWTDYENLRKAYKKNDPMNEVIGDIMKEFGCFEY
jgi:hypothetical protein